nr:hypothetical protein [Candidatus Levybacteria bacterium]
MNDLNLKELTEELKIEGALEKEAEDLVIFSKNLSNLYAFERSDEFKNKFLEQELLTKNKFFGSRQMFATAFLSLVLLLGVTSVVGAQGSLPGQPLYPIKIASENIASFINPSFKDEILQRRSEEIKQLSGKKDGDTFHNTVNEYEKELNENKAISPKKIEESKKNLEEAKINSLDEHKEDIERVIIKTETRQGEVKGDEDRKISPEENNREINKESEYHPGF